MGERFFDHSLMNEGGEKMRDEKEMEDERNIEERIVKIEKKTKNLNVGIKIKGFYKKDYFITLNEVVIKNGFLNFKNGDYLTFFDSIENSILRIYLDEDIFIIKVKEGLFNYVNSSGKVIVSIRNLIP